MSYTRVLNTEAPCILRIMLSHRNPVVLKKMKWVCFIFLWNLTTNTLMMIYSSSSSPPSSSAFSAIIAVDWKTPRACTWEKYQLGTSNLLAIFVWGANAQRQFALVKLSSISCTCLHPLEIFLSVVVGVEVLVGLDPGSESIKSNFNQASMMHTWYL